MSNLILHQIIWHQLFFHPALYHGTYTKSRVRTDLLDDEPRCAMMAFWLRINQHTHTPTTSDLNVRMFVCLHFHFCRRISAFFALFSFISHPQGGLAMLSSCPVPPVIWLGVIPRFSPIHAYLISLSG